MARILVASGMWLPFSGEPRGEGLGGDVVQIACGILTGSYAHFSGLQNAFGCLHLLSFELERGWLSSGCDARTAFAQPCPCSAGGAPEPPGSHRGTPKLGGQRVQARRRGHGGRAPPPQLTSRLPRGGRSFATRTFGSDLHREKGTGWRGYGAGRGGGERRELR